MSVWDDGASSKRRRVTLRRYVIPLREFVFSDTYTKVQSPLVTVVRSKFGVLLPKKCPQMYRAIIPENTPGRTDLFCFVTETSTLCQ